MRGEYFLEGVLMGEETREEEREEGRGRSLHPKFNGIFQLSLSRSAAKTLKDASLHLKGDSGAPKAPWLLAPGIILTPRAQWIYALFLTCHWLSLARMGLRSLFTGFHHCFSCSVSQITQSPLFTVFLSYG